MLSPLALMLAGDAVVLLCLAARLAVRHSGLWARHIRCTARTNLDTNVRIVDKEVCILNVLYVLVMLNTQLVKDIFFNRSVEIVKM